MRKIFSTRMIVPGFIMAVILSITCNGFSQSHLGTKRSRLIARLSENAANLWPKSDVITSDSLIEVRFADPGNGCIAYRYHLDASGKCDAETYICSNSYLEGMQAHIMASPKFDWKEAHPSRYVTARPTPIMLERITLDGRPALRVSKTELVLVRRQIRKAE